MASTTWSHITAAMSTTPDPLVLKWLILLGKEADIIISNVAEAAPPDRGSGEARDLRIATMIEVSYPESSDGGVPLRTVGSMTMSPRM